ncbi:FG-GAP-like repeat-containing protein [Actinacidiphila sp. DG2A-62]|uniref:FG-GAP-like repeat-containing protein n=1 Tax=Actinacidiphila sp. DG2A-62 TaxID=3108821 RepID=UPI002DBE268D|nr:FG-GAP-like repeat-containing protein [Actinacidiphila sp. DG2A-62]MEC3992765.1 FG-GAP-like repeat-containing protein [Actinacidiphila sp. DG2A-62]
MASAVGVVAGGTAPAHAVSGWDRCPRGSVCLFDGDGGTGSMIAYSSPQAGLGSWDNRANSVYNRTGQHFMCMYPQAQYKTTVPNADDSICYLGSGNDQVELKGDGEPLWNGLSSIRWAHTWRQAAGGPEYRSWATPLVLPPGPAQPFADLNGDGTPDQLNRTWNGHLWFLKGDGSGVYVGSGWNQMTALTRHGDFSGDGHEDLLARDGSGKLWIYPGNGKGWFGARKLIGTGWNQMTALQAAGDMNSDGHDDLLARDSTGRLWIYPGDGHGRYGTRKLIGAGGWSMFPTVLGIGDVDRDGRPDLQAAGDGDYYTEARLYYGTPGGSIAQYGDNSPVDLGDRLL